MAKGVLSVIFSLIIFSDRVVSLANLVKNREI